MYKAAERVFFGMLALKTCRRIQTGYVPLPAKSRASLFSVILTEKLYDTAEARLARGPHAGVNCDCLRPERGYREPAHHGQRSEGQPGDQCYGYGARPGERGGAFRDRK